MATDAQLQRSREQTRDLRRQLNGLEEVNGYTARRIGKRALKFALTNGGGATAGAISGEEFGGFKLRWLNWGIGGIGGGVQVFVEPDGVADILMAFPAGVFTGQLAVSASGGGKTKSELAKKAAVVPPGG